MFRPRGQGVLEQDDDPFTSAIESWIFHASRSAGFDFSALGGHQPTLPGLQGAVLGYSGNVTEAGSASGSADIVVQPLEAGALTFTLHDVGGVTPGSQAEAGFLRATALWQSFLGDTVNIRLDVGFSSLGPGILGSTGSTGKVVSYAAVRAALNADQTSSDDAAAVASLSAGASLAFFTNNSAGTRVFDNDGSVNNTHLFVTTADLKALGITTDANGQPVDTGAADGSIRFSSDFNWDFDPSNGITAGAIDFVGVAFHEIGHALGFVSGVDTVDYYSGSGPGGRTNLNPYAIFTTLDLFRYSASGVRDLSYGGTKYFSLNAGATNLALFSTGDFQGDGNQASHWKDGLGIGIMDPTSVPAGQANVITARDIQALDAIGWNRVGSSGPGSVSINDVQISEGNSGTQIETFTVTRSGGTAAFAVNFSTSNNSATTADNDYFANAGTLNFTAGVNTRTVSVTIVGDTKVESDEAFFVTLSGATNGATIGDNIGAGTITDDDATLVFGPATFQFANFAPGAGGWSSDNTYPRELADVNGDGMADIVGFGYGGVSVALATGGGAFGSPTFQLAAFAPGAGGWSSDNSYPRELADVNGDHMADIVGFGDGGVSVALATGGGAFGSPTFQLAAFAPGAGGWASDDTYPRLLADVNGDGMADIVGFGSGGVAVALATGGGAFASATFSMASFGASDAAGGWSSNDLYPRLLADLNGDGMADIVGFGDKGVAVALATGGGSFGPSSLKLAAFGTSSSAGGWSSNDLYPRQLADVNGDGKIDIVGFGDKGVAVALGNGDGSFQSATADLRAFAPGAGGWSSEDTYPRLLADVNGDGAADIVGFGYSGVAEALSNGFHLI
ncbi:MAG: serralysin [Bradyrhizobium sp.]|jgi:hypothetical protein|nr:serralysin [Bradyrhizobium sp.]